MKLLSTFTFKIFKTGSGYSFKATISNVSMSKLPEANTIQGVSHESVHIDAVNNLNKLLADSAGDKLGNAQAFDVNGGKRTRRKLNGRRNNRSRRRRNNKSSTRRRRSRRSVV
jgi:hypothetical protein